MLVRNMYSEEQHLTETHHHPQHQQHNQQQLQLKQRSHHHSLEDLNGGSISDSNSFYSGITNDNKSNPWIPSAGIKGMEGYDTHFNIFFLYRSYFNISYNIFYNILVILIYIYILSF